MVHATSSESSLDIAGDRARRKEVRVGWFRVEVATKGVRI